MTTLELGKATDGTIFSLPEDAITAALGIVGRRGSGKTTTAMVLCEEFVDKKLPVVILDPLGVCWGLRSSVDGEHAGRPVTILGGSHGDVPLESTAGSVVAELVVQNPSAYILDLSSFKSGAEQDRFARDFAQRLYAAKGERREALHLVVDEADSFAPQRAVPGQQAMLGAFEALVRRGRSRGIGVTLITQRPAVLNKNVLSQVECLIAMQVTAPQDRAALKLWAEGNADKEQVATFLESLAPLQVGEAWVWSPAWLRVFERVNVRQRQTFDSSATPKAGEKRTEPRVLAPVDLEMLRTKMAATIEKAAADDPKALRAEVARLRREIETRPVADCGHEGIIATLTADLERHASDLGRIRIRLADVLGGAESLQRQIETILEDDDANTGTVRVGSERQPGRVVVGNGTGRPETPRRSESPGRQPAQLSDGLGTLPSSDRAGVGRSEGTSGASGLSKAERAILTSLAQYPEGRTRRQAGILTGYSSKSGGFNGAIAALRSKGYVTPREPLVATPEGVAALGEFEPLPTGQALLEHWCGQLDKAPAAILRRLAEAYPAAMSKEEVATALGYSVNSGGFNGALARLRALELIERGTPRLSDDLAN